MNGLRGMHRPGRGALPAGEYSEPAGEYSDTKKLRSDTWGTAPGEYSNSKRGVQIGALHVRAMTAAPGEACSILRGLGPVSGSR